MDDGVKLLLDRIETSVYNTQQTVKDLQAKVNRLNLWVKGCLIGTTIVGFLTIHPNVDISEVLPFLKVLVPLVACVGVVKAVHTS